MSGKDFRPPGFFCALLITHMCRASRLRFAGSFPSVTPAEAGIQGLRKGLKKMDSGSKPGMTEEEKRTAVREDFHLQVSAPCRAHTKTAALIRGGRVDDGSGSFVP